MIIVGALVALIVIGALAATTFLKPQDSVTAAHDKSTKLAFYDNGECWIHSVAVFWDVKVNNTTKTETYFADMWMKPKDKDQSDLYDLPGKGVIDLSNMLGYGNQPLPAGTTMRVKVFSDILSNEYAGQTHDFKSAVQGWSNAEVPQNLPDYSQLLNLVYAHKVYELPANIKDNQITLTSDPTKGAEFLQGVKCVHYEFLLTVNPDGTVNLKMTEPPIFCEHMASSNWREPGDI